MTAEELKAKKIADARAVYEEKLAGKVNAKENAAQLRKQREEERKAANEARLAERTAANKAAAEARAAALADQQAKLEAQKAEKDARAKALADAKAATATATQLQHAARQAERAAANKAAAEARAAALAAKKAEIEAKKAAKPVAARPVPAPRPAARPERPAAKPAIAPKGNPKAAASVGFDIQVGLSLNAGLDEMLQNAMRDAGKAAAKQVGDLLVIAADMDVKTRRPLEAAKQKAIKAIERGVASSLSRLLEPQSLDGSTLYVSEDGTRVKLPTATLKGTEFLKNKAAATYKDLAQVIGEADNPLHQMGLKKNEMQLMFGDTLPNDYFFSGTFKLHVHTDKPAHSTIKQEVHIFAKRGKKMGAQFKLVLEHNLDASHFECRVDVDFPLTKLEA